MNPSDIFDLVGEWADKRQAKTLLFCENDTLWVVEVKTTPPKSAKGKSPLEAYQALAKAIGLELEKA